MPGAPLFLLYINDLLFALKKAKATMYADDTAISYSSDESEELDLFILFYFISFSHI